MKKLEPSWLDQSLFRTSVWYTLCTTEEMFYAEMKKCGVPEHKAGSWVTNEYSGATAHQFVIAENGKPCVVVCIRTRDYHTPIQIAGLLVHEAVHIWQYICERIGEDSPSHEFEAYSVQWLAQELMEEYVRQTK